MIKFGRDKVLLLHQLMIAETGGSADVRDLGLLDSALESAYATFVDGNKRIGIYVMFTFLEVNGIRLEATNDEVAAVGLSIASGETSHADLLEWIKTHKV